MYAAHFAAGLAIKSRVPRAPTAVLLFAAFVPDFVWIVLALAGVEPAKPETFFDDWSHSLLMCVVWSGLFSFFFRSLGRRVIAAISAAGLSHFALDAPIHPKDLALYPHSSLHLGYGLWSIGPVKYWWVQLAVVVVLLSVYVQGARKAGIARRNVVWSAAYILAFHVISAPV